jgi:hypothetical protein
VNGFKGRGHALKIYDYVSSHDTTKEERRERERDRKKAI